MTTPVPEPASGADDLERLAAAARDALTDDMVSRLAEAAAGGLGLIDQVNRAGLDRAIPAFAQLVASGDLDRLVQLARLYSSAQDALTDDMIGRMAEAVGEGLSLLDRFNRGGADRLVSMLERLESRGALERIANVLPRLADRLEMLEGMLAACERASAETRAAPMPAGGLVGLWQLARQPQTHASLQFLVRFANAVRSGAEPPGAAGR